MSKQHLRLQQYTQVFGPPYGTEDKSVFLYSIVKMQRPKTILEIGTGLGVCAFQMAAAVQENGHGHVFTLDNGSHWTTTSELVRSLALVPNDTTYADFLAFAARQIGVPEQLTFLHETVPPFPVLDEPVDLLFTDYMHVPQNTLETLGFYLPLMADCASIFIDSASTLRQTYEMLEGLIPRLDAGELPANLAKHMAEGQRESYAASLGERRFQLVHLTEAKDRSQNSMAWIRIEPREGGPYPATKMR